MNVLYILKMIESHARKGELTYDDFEKIFSMLALREQYRVADILHENGIELVEEYSAVEPADASPPVEQSPIVRRKVKSSNEILCSLIQEGNRQARQDLCVKNAGLVGEQAKYFSGIRNNDLAFEDLEQAGMIGLLTAAEKFRPELGHQFSTYAMWWIRQSILRTIYNEGYTIRLPIYLFDRIKNMFRVSNQLLYEYGREPTDKELAQKLELSIDRVRALRKIAGIVKVCSLDMPIGEEGDTTFGEMIPQEEYDLEDEVIKIFLREQLDEALSTLKTREIEVISLRFGLDDGHCHTLEEVGKIFGVTRERIRQIEAQALCKLRHPSRSKHLKGFLN